MAAPDRLTQVSGDWQIQRDTGTGLLIGDGNGGGKLTVVGETGSSVVNFKNNGDVSLFSVDNDNGIVDVASGILSMNSIIFMTVPSGDNLQIGHLALNNITPTSAVGNNAVGYDALRNLTTGDYNVALGNSALRAVTTNGNNVGIGHAAGYNTTGPDNVYVGFESGYNITSGYGNVAIGNNAGRSVGGSENTIVGTNAGVKATSANVIIGYYAANTATGNNTIVIGNRSAYRVQSLGAGNVFIGAYTGGNYTGASFGNNNIGIGFQALEDLETGADNVGIGYQSLLNVTTGGSNTAVGSGALDSITTTSLSAAFGTNALGALTSGDRNTAIGASAGSSQTSGTQNTYIGALAGYTKTSGDGDIFIGHQTTANLGASGGYNIIIGNYAGDNITTGGNNIVIGAFSKPNTNMSGVIVIGYNRTAYTSSTVLLGNTDLYLGQEQTGSPATSTIHGQDALGTDIVGGSLYIVGGRSTGTGNGGNILFRTSGAGASGSSLNALATVMEITQSGRVAIGNVTPNTKLDVNGDIAHRVTTPASFSTDQADFPTAGTSFIRLENTAGSPVNLSGFANGYDGKRLVVTNVFSGAQAIVLKHNDAASAAANRLLIFDATTGVLQDYTLNQGDAVEFIYDATEQKWVKIN